MNKFLCELEWVNKYKTDQYKSYKHLKKIRFVIPAGMTIYVDTLPEGRQAG